MMDKKNGKFCFLNSIKICLFFFWLFNMILICFVWLLAKKAFAVVRISQSKQKLPIQVWLKSRNIKCDIKAGDLHVSANGFSPKAPESGGQRKQLPYYVETPYGFHLDLDFLKYVDDIEKGNTIKRVHIQRRSKGPKFSTLPRNFSLPGHAARSVPRDTWASTCTLGHKTKSRVMEVEKIYEFRPCEGRSPSYPRAPGVSYRSDKAVEDATIRAFDEQPLGLHIRPHLLRASSMPVTVMRKSSESSEVLGPQATGESYRENGSSENVSRSLDVGTRRSGVLGEHTGLHQQFATALQRVRELEEQVKTIPKLKAQILLLQEEKEQLLRRLNSQPVVNKCLPCEHRESAAQQHRLEDASVSSTITAELRVEQPLIVPGDDNPIYKLESEGQEETERFVEPKLGADDKTASITDQILIQVTVAEVTEVAKNYGSRVEWPLEQESVGPEPAMGTQEMVSKNLLHQEELLWNPLAETPDKNMEAEGSTSTNDVTVESPSSHKEVEQVETMQRSPSIQEAAHLRLVMESLSTKEPPGHEEPLKTAQPEQTASETHVVFSEGGMDPTYQQAGEDSEALIIQALQAKLAALEEQLCDIRIELENTNALLSEKIEENKVKEERIKQLMKKLRVYSEEDMEDTDESDQKTDDLVETAPSFSAGSPSDLSVNKNAEELTLTYERASANETMMSSNTSGQLKDLASSSTQTDVIEVQDRAVSVSVLTTEKYVEVGVTVCDQAVETDPQEDPCRKTQEETLKAEEPNVSVEPMDQEGASSDLLEEAGCLVELKQPCQLDPGHQRYEQDGEEVPATNAAIGQYVTRIQGLLTEQWACLSSGHPEIASTLKQPASKISSIQTQLVSSLNALSTFYSSPGQKGATTQQAGLKSIMKKNDDGSRPGSGSSGGKKNLKFVGVNGGYETTSSEESSGEDNVDDSSEPEEQEKSGDTSPQEPVHVEAAGSDGDPSTPVPCAGSQDEPPRGETVDEDFMEACIYLKDRLAEISSPDKEMRQVLMVLYQEWFRVSSQMDSLVDTVTLYLKQVAFTAPTLLHFLINLADGNGNTALHYSVSHSNFAIVRLLLDTGLCDVDHQNKAGYTAVMLASLTAADGPDDVEVALQLLRLGDVNAQASQAGQTALMLAASHGRTAMVRVLLACGADVDTQDHDGYTALMCACEQGHAEIARLLLERGCDRHLVDKVGITKHRLTEITASSLCSLG
uniref:KN motif and ankyrin repeat domains 4 n=1 Tax=Paramormyrops kingsleyae TaxID=1676925 RepID=A0A3B3SP56_9TELE